MPDRVEIERQKMRDRLKRRPAPDDRHQHNGQANGHAANGKPKAKHNKARTRFQVMNDFVDQSARLVDTTAQAVWLVLFRETKPNGVATISHNQIAELIGVSRRTVLRAVDALEKAGLVETVVQGGIGRDRKPSTYRVHGTPKVTPASPTATSPR